MLLILRLVTAILFAFAAGKYLGALSGAQIILGTIAAAAVINEIIAVVVAKKGFEWAGEFSKENTFTPSNLQVDKP